MAKDSNPSRAVKAPLKIGDEIGLIMFSCTGRAADRLEKRLSEGGEIPISELIAESYARDFPSDSTN